MRYFDIHTNYTTDDSSQLNDANSRGRKDPAVH